MLYIEDIIFQLQKYWQQHNCCVISSYDFPMGAATFHPVTIKTALEYENGRFVYIQPSRRPDDSRFSLSSHRSQKHHQLQVIIKPLPDNILDMFLDSLEFINLSTKDNDIQFIANNWQSPTLGASGIGWEIVCNGMEIMQFTYFQQIGGIICNPTTVELAYGIERLALQIQKATDFGSLQWNKNLTYNDLFAKAEDEFSQYYVDYADTVFLNAQMDNAIVAFNKLCHLNLFYPAYEKCLWINYIFNVLDATKTLDHTKRTEMILMIRGLFTKCCNMCTTNL